MSSWDRCRLMTCSTAREGDDQATEKTTTKVFVGGKVFADLDTGEDTNEPLERQDLYSQCGIGTPPSFVAGEWRSVRITDDCNTLHVRALDHHQRILLLLPP